MKPSLRPVPELWLEQYRLGELDSRQRQEIESQLASDPQLRARLVDLKEDDEAILAAHPPAQARRRIEARLETAANRRRWAPYLATVAPAAAAAALLFAVFGPDTADEPARVVTEVTRIKGLNPSLSVHRQQGGESHRLPDGAVATAHDLVQLSYLAAGRPHGVILSIDGRGAVTVHHPTQPGGDTHLLVGGEAALPNAYELDDAPEFERFFLVTSETAIDDLAVVRAAETLARTPARAALEPLPLPATLEQTSVLLHKQAEVKP